MTSSGIAEEKKVNREYSSLRCVGGGGRDRHQCCLGDSWAWGQLPAYEHRRKALSQNFGMLPPLPWSDLLFPTGTTFIFPHAQTRTPILCPRPQMTLSQEKGFLSNQLGQGYTHPSGDSLKKGGKRGPQQATLRVRVLELGAKEPGIVLRMRTGSILGRP